jgi:hypothetical protein
MRPDLPMRGVLDGEAASVAAEKAGLAADSGCVDGLSVTVTRLAAFSLGA